MNFRLSHLIIFAFALAGYGIESVSAQGDGKPTIFVPVPPYAGLVEALAGEHVQVEALASENDDPHTYTPTPRELAYLSAGTVYFTAGLPFEDVLVQKLKESNSAVKIISLVEGLEQRAFAEGEHDHSGHDHEGHDHEGHDHEGHDHEGHDHEGHDHEGHDHEGHDHEGHDHEGHDHDEHDHEGHDHEGHDHDEHDHEGHDHDEHDHKGHDHDEHDHEGHDHEGHDHSDCELDPHVWLSPAHLVEQLRTIQNELMPLLESEEAKASLNENAKSLIQKIRETDRELAEQLAPLRGQSFYVYHGAFGYFADAYGLKQVPVELSGRSPEPRQIASMIDRAKEEGVSVVFVQPQFDQTSAKALADSIDGTVVSIDPLAKDVVANLKLIADKIEASKAPE